MKPIMVKLLGMLAVSCALDPEIFIAFAQGQPYSLVTITNPTPEPVDNFANSLAVVGADRILIGAYRDDTGATNSGAAYLYRGNGELLLTITNPTPAAGDNFGQSVTAVGAACFLIGAPNDDVGVQSAGAAYLFSLNGELLMTFTNPTPALGDSFGIELAAIGDNRVLISAPNDDTGETNAGSVYLFNTNGTLLTTFTNPAPGFPDGFGVSMSGVGNDRLIIGAPLEDRGAMDAGVAYLFSTNGALILTFTNPAPAAQDNFGFSVVAVGSDRVLIGAFGDDTGALDAGSVYLFRTNGTLVATYTNPAPASFDAFGISMAAVGAGDLLIGAHQDDAGATNAGAVYLFSTNGSLLTIFTNPTPEVGDNFGRSVAGFGADRVVIGAQQDDTGAANAGAAYLFTRVVPRLSIQLTITNTVAVSWPWPSTGWTLQENTNGVSSVNWSNAPGPIQDDGTNKTLMVDPPAGNRFYRLFKP